MKHTKRLTLKEARRFRGLTQVELAAKSGVDQTTISSLETGRKSNPTFNTVIALARVLEVEPQRLIFGVPAPAQSAEVA